jgi:hypothetical protein
VVRLLSDEEFASQADIADNYARRSARYQTDLVRVR